MALDINQVNRIMGAARGRDLGKVEELWIELQSTDGAVDQLKLFLDVANEVASRGDRDKAAELLLLLKDDLKSQDREDELFDVLRTAVSYSGRIKGVRDELLVQYRRKYGERSGLEALISRTGLADEGNLGEAVEQLDQAFYFAEGDFVFHGRGWGIGRVVEARPEAGEFVIDFGRRRGQRMEAGMAKSALEPRGPTDLDVLLWTDKDRVRALADEDPLGLLRSALAASGGKVQSRDLRQKLSPVLEKTAWTKFWAKARKAAKDDPRIEVGPAPRSIISLRDVPLSREEEVGQSIERIHDFRERLTIARRELLATRKDSNEAPSWLAAGLKALEKGHGSTGSAEQRAARIELALFKSEVAEAWPSTVDAGAALDPETGEPLPAAAQVKDALQGLEGDAFPRVLREVSVNEYRRRLVRLVSEVFEGDTVVETLQAVLLDPPPQTWDAAVAALQDLGREDLVSESANKILISPNDYPEALAAFARVRLSGNLELLPERTDPEILVKALQVFDTVNLEFKGTLDRKKKADLKSTVEALRTLISEKSQRVLGQVIREGTEDDVRRVLQLVRQSPTLTSTIKRATEKFVMERFPELLATVATTPRHDLDAADVVLFSTTEGKRRRERELAEILDVKLEAVRIEIGKALEFGDISENSELDAARETQQRLAEQAERIRIELERVELIDPAGVETDAVRVGTRVRAENLESNEDEVFTILGPWDLDEEDPTIISHLSALALGLMGHKPNETAVVTLPSGRKVEYKIKAIERAGVLENA